MSEKYRLEDIPEEYGMITEEWELEIIQSRFGLEEIPTGAMVKTRDGDYESVYVSHSQRPYLLSSLYEKIL